MAGYACFTNRGGRQTWWRLTDEGHGVFLCDDNEIRVEGREQGIMNAPTAWDEERLVRQDYDELPDEVLARVAAHQLLKGID